MSSACRETDIHQVDAHNIVPVWVASDKIEYAARTIRPKIHNHLGTFLVDFPAPSSYLPSKIKCEPVPSIDWDEVYKSLKVDKNVPAGIYILLPLSHHFKNDLVYLNIIL